MHDRPVCTPTHGIKLVFGKHNMVPDPETGRWFL